METDFKAKEQAEAAILNTKKEWLKKQDELQDQMKQLEEKVTQRPLDFSAITHHAHRITLPQRIASKDRHKMHTHPQNTPYPLPRPSST